MPRYMQVVGPDDDDDDVSGFDVMGESVMGRRKRRGRVVPTGNGGIVRVREPDWRQGQLAPGVYAPDEGLVPLPLHALNGNDTFSLATQNITFAGQLQKPFRGERLLVDVVRTGASATGRLLSQLFVGTDMQQADIQGFDLQQVGNSQAFGVRLTMKAAQPGVLIQIPTRLSSALAGADTIFCTVTLLGRIVH